MISFLISYPSLLKPFVKQLQRKDYDKAIWELCHIKHEAVNQMLAIILEYKAELGISLDKKFGRDEQSALHIAAKMGSTETYRLLVASGANEQLPDSSGEMPKNHLAKINAACSL